MYSNEFKEELFKIGYSLQKICDLLEKLTELKRLELNYLDKKYSEPPAKQIGNDKSPN